jgi:hypothetical protein
MSAFVRITRSGVSGGIFRSIAVRIDDKEVSTIAYGSECLCVVIPGEHAISVCIDAYFGSPVVHITVSEGQTLHYRCREPGLLEGGIFWMIRPKHYLILEPSS